MRNDAWNDVELGIDWIRGCLKAVKRSGSSTPKEVSAADDAITALLEVEHIVKKVRR